MKSYKKLFFCLNYEIFWGKMIHADIERYFSSFLKWFKDFFFIADCPFKFASGPGDFVGPIHFRMAHHSKGKAGWLTAQTPSFHQIQLASGCIWIWFADSTPTLVVVVVHFIKVLWFSPAPKNQNPYIFLVHSFWLPQV